MKRALLLVAAWLILSGYNAPPYWLQADSCPKSQYGKWRPSSPKSYWAKGDITVEYDRLVIERWGSFEWDLKHLPNGHPYFEFKKPIRWANWISDRVDRWFLIIHPELGDDRGLSGGCRVEVFLCDSIEDMMKVTERNGDFYCSSGRYGLADNDPYRAQPFDPEVVRKQYGEFPKGPLHRVQ